MLQYLNYCTFILFLSMFLLCLYVYALCCNFLSVTGITFSILIFIMGAHYPLTLPLLVCMVYGDELGLVHGEQ